MRLFKFTSPNGHLSYVNLDQLVFIESADSGKLMLWLADGDGDPVEVPYVGDIERLKALLDANVAATETPLAGRY